MTYRYALLAFALANPAAATQSRMSEPLDGFKAEQVLAVTFRNPADAIMADPRFEPEQTEPSIEIVWTRDGQMNLWADVVYRNPDTGIYREKNERFQFRESENGGWLMIGSWARWKCLGQVSETWTTEQCDDD